jgi:uncharacterized protein
MQDVFNKALTASYERIIVWADILDRINVFPVPDGDTGRNLVITLGALKRTPLDFETVNREILRSARGNSGNIAARFLSGFLGCHDLKSLPASAEIGRDLAYQAVSDPKPGTMLTVYESLVTSLKKIPPDETGQWVEEVISNLTKTVKATTDQLPELKKAGVVDAGALGMLVFFDSLLPVLAGRQDYQAFFLNELKETLNLSPTWHNRKYDGYCFDVVLKMDQEKAEEMKRVSPVGESLVTLSEGGYFKIHLHAPDKEKVRQELGALGNILNWSEDNLGEQTSRFAESKPKSSIHIISDAAGSLSRDLARNLGITLLNSYITVGQDCLAESYMDPEQLFMAMRKGARVSTSQASTTERHEYYKTILKLYDRVLYLCVGSFYTGNFASAVKWKAENDPEDRFTVIDTGLASGKLGLLCRAVAERASMVSDSFEVIAFARNTLKSVQEYIFLDRLHFLAAGGRMSKTSAFMGDVLHIKPIISPFPNGARKIGMVRNRTDQIKFAFERLEKELPKDQKATLLLEYSDNREWLEAEIKPEVENRFPRAKVFMQLLSLTSAVHMGPGTWGLAFLPNY